MVTKIIDVEVGRRTPINTDGLNNILKGLVINAEDSYDLEDILDCAIQSLYLAQPEGQINYGRKNPNVGKIWLCRSNNEQGYGNANIEYAPSDEYNKKWKYIQKTIGTIDLRGRNYSAKWNGDDSHQIPKVLIKDTKKVMECLGLKKKNKD